MLSRRMGFSGKQSVSPVKLSFGPKIAAMSPAGTSSMSTRRSAKIRTIRPMRSRLPLLVFKRVVPVLSTPLYTRTKPKRPTKGSVMILKTNAESGSSLLASRVMTIDSSSGSVPLTGGMSSGEGNKATTQSNKICTPLFLSAEPHTTG